MRQKTFTWSETQFFARKNSGHFGRRRKVGISISKDVESIIIPGLTHQQSPHHHAYFLVLNSLPSLLEDMLSDDNGWVVLETIQDKKSSHHRIGKNWFGKMNSLADAFLHTRSDYFRGSLIQIFYFQFSAI